MTTLQIGQSVLEILMVLLIAAGFLFEGRVARFERRLGRKIRRRFRQMRTLLTDSRPCGERAAHRECCPHR